MDSEKEGGHAVVTTLKKKIPFIASGTYKRIALWKVASSCWSLSKFH